MVMEESNLNYEKAIERLEEIVKKLESGGLSLEKSLEKFEEGVRLVKYCNKELNKAEKKVEMVIKEGDEFTDVIPFKDETEENK